ncbi:MAG TPA: F0F1 ATP synthase subunit B, partial [Dehalococcoidia bacterium]|nr:F0F1 ATP synthase subunit B [Dehalococcoidia bacterium]
IILFVLLSVFLYKPVTRMLDERQAKIKESMDQAEEIRQQATRSEEEIKKQLAVAHKEAQQIIAQATQIGERLKVETKEEARKEAGSMVTRAKVEIQRQRDKDMVELRAQFADIAILAAEKVIKETLDRNKNSKLIEEILKENSKLI